MGYFKGARETITIILNDRAGKPTGYWVTMYKDVKWSESKNWVRLNSNGQPDVVTAATPFLRARITEWNLDDEKGNIVPVTEEAIDGLDGENAMQLLAAIGVKPDSVQVVEKKSSSKSSKPL